MREGGYHVRTRTPPRRRSSGRELSPPRHRRRISPPPPSRHRRSPVPRGREFSPVRSREEYSLFHQPPCSDSEEQRKSHLTYGTSSRDFASAHAQRDRSKERLNRVGELSPPFRGHLDYSPPRCHDVAEHMQSQTHSQFASGSADFRPAYDDMRWTDAVLPEERRAILREGGSYKVNALGSGDRGEDLPTTMPLDKGLSYGDSTLTKFRWNHLLEEKQGSVSMSRDTVIPHIRSTGADYLNNAFGTESQRFRRSKEVSDKAIVPKPAFLGDDVKARNFPGYLGSSVRLSDRYQYTDGNYAAPLANLGWNDPISNAKLLGIESSRVGEIGKSSLNGDSANAISNTWTRTYSPLPVHVPDNGTLPSSYKSWMKTYSPLPVRVPDDDALPSSRENGHLLPSEGFSWSHGTGKRDAFAEVPPLQPSTGSEFPLRDLLHYNKILHLRGDDTFGVNNNFEGQRKERSDVDNLPDRLFYEERDNIRETYGLHDSSKASLMRLVEDKQGGYEIPQEDCLTESWKLDRPDYPTEASHTRGRDECFGLGRSHGQYRKETYLDSKSLQLGGEDAFGNSDDLWVYRDGVKNMQLPELNNGSHERDWNPQHRLSVEEMGAIGQSERSLKRKNSMDFEIRGHYFESDFYRNQNASHKIWDPHHGNEDWSDEDSHLYDDFQPGTIRRTFKADACERNGVYDDDLSCEHLPVRLQGRLRKPIKSRSRDIHKRLGPPQKTWSSVPWAKRHFHRRNPNDHDVVEGGDSIETQVDLSEDEAAYAKAELPENSKEFKQLVKDAFLKYFKFLNETSTQRRKYTGQRGSGQLKCGVCGSNSKEFGSALALVMHTVMSKNVGCRVEHLGFHKALCVLLGWDSAPATNGPWACKLLPPSQASSLREDLIIWPPVVVIHNSSIGNASSGDRVIISIEDLQAVLPGLLEAERLHQYFAENEHGRAELEQRSCASSRGSGRRIGSSLADKVASVLYGYFGIAEDLDKLDFETKKRSVVRSKKEMQHFVDAALENQ
ncbi:uncharacterized protein LOC115734300 isoform X2 [Rhodamnia argentea]|uniref:Uncharacterized protein LOC115734300 isoform X2 n=1 Tax=Rhodamnia argentea TaxID=178133 RepID=A0ABM3HIB1_9MYRT|nr:uncharacterized protein LOC115734300 isoform X2 [Rhodamnia argentea]